MKKKIKKSKGITLIALIITIIILLILLAVGIDIAMDGQIFNIAEEAVNKTNHKVGEVQNEVYDLEDEMDDVKQWACQHEFGEWIIIKEATETETGTRERVCSKCGYIQRETIPAIAAEPAEIALVFDPQLTTWTNEDVVVTASIADSGNIAQLSQDITKNGSVMRLGYTGDNFNPVLVANSDYTIQMSKDGTNWSTTNRLTYDENGDVYARVMKNGTQVGEIAEGKVTNIDKVAPTVGKIEVYEDEYCSDGSKFAISNNYLYVSTDYCTEVYVKFINGVDNKNGSGILKTTYTISYYGFDQDVYVFDDTTTTLPLLMLDLNGAYEVTSRMGGMETEFTISIETIDNAGNTVTDQYTIFLEGSDVVDI